MDLSDRAESILTSNSYQHSQPGENNKQHNYRSCTDEPEFFTDDRKNKIGGIFRQMAVFANTFPEAAAE